MTRILAALLLLPALALGAGNDLLINQRNPSDTATLTRGVAPPDGGGTSGILGYAGSSNLPVFFRIGAGLALSSGSLVALPQAWADITGKPTLAPVATSGSYLDLSNRPTIPAAQVQTDWNAVSGLGVLLNKPTLAPIATAGTYASLTGIPSSFTPAAHTQTWSTITATPTTLAGYGITDAATASQLAAKFNTPTGTTAQYVRGDGSLATLPAAKRIETYSGTTDASGRITVTYGTAYPAVPVVQPPAPAAANQVWTTVASTTTGFTLQLNQRNTVTLLSVEVLLGATVPVTGTTATVLVVAQ